MNNKFQEFLVNKIEPLSNKITENKTISTIMEAMMLTMPLMLGRAVFSIIAEFPLSEVTTFLTDIGVKTYLDAFLETSNNISPIFICFLVGYTYAKKSDLFAIPAGLFSLLTYFVLIPETMTVGEETIVAYSSQYLGGNGIFVAMIIGIVISKIYVWITKKNIVIKMPESVPTMVSQSFESVFSGVIIIGLAIVLKGVLAISPFENVFNIVTVCIQGPIMKLGANVPALIILQIIAQFFWYFGIHPIAITSLYIPVFTTILGSNWGAYLAGEPLPYLAEGVVYTFTNLGGSGSLIGLAICMAFFSKSKRYKTMGKISFVPAVFNIQEPMMFGVPVIMNPMFFFHLVLSPLIAMGIGYVAINLGLFSYNPIIANTVPWTTPMPILGFLVGGLPMMLIFLLIIAINVAIYFPFFKALDRKEYKLEQEAVGTDSESVTETLEESKEDSR